MKRTRRFQVSLLSKNRFHEAVTEEVMIDKTTGEILVKSPDGHFASFDYISRTQSAMEKLTSLCELRGFYPTIHRVLMDDIFFPAIYQENTNLLTEPIVLPTEKPVRRMMVYVDASSIRRTTEFKGGISAMEPHVSLTVSYKASGSDEIRTKTFSGSLERINGIYYDGFRLDGLEDLSKLEIVSISDIQLQKNPALTEGDHAILVHNIFVCFAI